MKDFTYSHSTGYASVYVNEDVTLAKIKYNSGKILGPYKVHYKRWHYDGSYTFEVEVPVQGVLGWFGATKIVDYGS